MHQSLREQMGADGTQIYSTQLSVFCHRARFETGNLSFCRAAMLCTHNIDSDADSTNYHPRADCFQSIESIISLHQIHRNGPTRGECIVESNIEINFKSARLIHFIRPLPMNHLPTIIRLPMIHHPINHFLTTRHLPAFRHLHL